MRLSPAQTKSIVLAASATALLVVLFLVRGGSERPPAPVEDVRLSEAFDWNLAKPGPLADEARTLTTERLFDLGSDGRYIYRLGAALNVDGAVAKVVLKDGVYWTDQVQLTADHVVDAWQRLRDRATQDPSLVDDPVERKWLQNVVVKPTGKLEFELTGYGTVEELSRLVRSRFLIPVRKDLLEKEGGAETAWLVTIGRYRLAAPPPATLPSTSYVEFVPNPSYYRGAASETVKVALAK